MEVDMLLNDLPVPKKIPLPQQPRHHSFSTLPSKVLPQGANPLHSLQAEERALEGQLSSLTDKREKLAGELEGLISQVSYCLMSYACHNDLVWSCDCHKQVT